MSEEGWKAFLHAEGVDDWVVLHGGPTAVYPVGSFREASALADAIAQVSGLDGSRALLTIADDHLTVRLTRGIFRLEAEHIELARAVSAIARSRGVAGDGAAVQEVQLAISAKHDDVDIEFWRAVLGYDPLAKDNAVDPLGHGRPSGCRSSTRSSRCGTPCTSTSPSPGNTSRRASAPLLPPEVASWTLGGARILDPRRPGRQQGMHRRLS